MYGYIYLTTNLINNKIYIGKHHYENFDMIDTTYYGSGKLLRKSIKKYGKENFEVKLLEWCETLEQLNKREIYWIEYYNSRDKNIGYNICTGGEGTNGYIFINDVKKVMSNKAKNRSHFPTTSNRIYIHKGTKNKCIKPEELDFYLNNGFIIGKYLNKSMKAWNKNLSAKTDSRVKLYTNKRNMRFENGESIGCYGLVGDNNYKRVNFLNKLNSIDYNEFITNYNNHGKCYCLSYYHFSYKKWNEICNHFNINK